MKHNEKTVATKNVYSGRIISLDLIDVELENGKVVNREVITHNGGVGVLPINHKDEVFLVEQFRKPYNCTTLEIPAGKLEKNEEALSCGIRELKEETGFFAQTMTFLTEMYPSPGYTNEIVYIYIAENLIEGESNTDENEFLNVHKYSLDEALNMINSGQIKDAKTITALLYAKLKNVEKNSQ